MNAVLYARVSTEKQADKDLSIPAQLQAMRDYARQRNWNVLEEFLEPGVSARTASRPVLQALLSRCRSDNRPDVVLVHKIDRLARNVYDHATIRGLLQQNKIALASVVENTDESVSGQLVENIMASIAQFYSGNLSEEVKKGMRQKVLKGGWPHLPPRGYIHVRADGAGGSKVEVNPKEGPLVRAGFEAYATGWHSLKTLAAFVYRKGLSSSNGRPLAPAQVRRMLSNPFYVGEIHWNGIEVPGQHESLVTRQLFETVQAVLRKRLRDPGAKGSVSGFPLKGLAICASCRGHMTAGRFKRRFGYYLCSRRSYNKTLCIAKGYTRADVAHAQVEALGRRLSLSRETADGVLKAAKKLVMERSAEFKRRLASLNTRRVQLTTRELRLTEAFVGGEVAPDIYKLTAKKLRTQLQGIDTDLAVWNRDQRPVVDCVARILDDARSFWELSRQLNEERQVFVMRTLFSNIVLDEGGVTGFTLRAPFDAMFPGGNAPRASKDIPKIALAVTRFVSKSNSPERIGDGQQPGGAGLVTPGCDKHSVSLSQG